MQFCKPHWQKLRDAIDARGLTALVSEGGQSVIDKLVGQLDEGTSPTLDNYDPLLSAMFAISGNVMQFLGDRALYLMGSGEEDPVDTTRAGPQYAGRVWSRCPLCYINLAHELTCTDPKCGLDKVDGYDWMINRAADEAKQFVDDKMLGGTKS